MIGDRHRERALNKSCQTPTHAALCVLSLASHGRGGQLVASLPLPFPFWEKGEKTASKLMLYEKKGEKTASEGCHDSMSSETSHVMEHTVCDRAMNILIDKQR
jgi:hypothetical protein